MKGFLARKLHFMRSSAKACPDTEQVKQLASRLPWGHVLRLQQPVKEPTGPARALLKIVASNPKAMEALHA